MDACAIESEEFGKNLQEKLQIFSLLANATRLKIALMIKDRERCVCELEASLGIDQSLISHHLREFKELRAVEERRDGKWRYYRLNHEEIKRVLEAVG